MDAVIYPPDDWEESEDFQLKKAVETVKSSELKVKLSGKNVPLRVP